METQKMIHGSTHGLNIEFPADMPYVLPVDGRRKRPVQDPVLIYLAFGIVPGVKCFGHMPAVMDHDIRGQEAVEGGAYIDV